MGGISAGSGAAGSLLITGCKVFNNAGITNPPAGSLGGGGGATIEVANGGQATIVDSSFYGNTRDGDGGGISFRVASGATGTISGCAIYGNSGDQGGGVLVAGNALLQQSTITGNTAYSGGGIYTYRRDDGPYIADCQISNNTAFYGGGVLVAGPGPGTTTMARCDISFNVANEAAQPNLVDRTGQGGGIYAATALPSVKKLVITSSSIAHNQAARHGGGIFGGASQIFASTISDNSAQIGGGLMMQGGGISDSTISGNSAVEGAGIYAKGIAISRSTIAGNKAAGSGGGLFLAADVLTLSDSIVENSAPSGPDIAALAGSVIDAHYNLIHSNGQSGLVASPPGAPDANGNLIGGTLGNSISALIGPLLYNGGPVLFDGVRILTHAILPGSPAIDAGDPAAAAGVGDVPQFDERGTPFMRVVGGRIDMGAVEYQPNPLLGDYNFDGIVDAADYTVWVDSQFTNQVYFSQVDLRADGDANGIVDQADYDFWKSHFGNTLAGSVASTPPAEAILISMPTASASPLAVTQQSTLNSRPTSNIPQSEISNPKLTTLAPRSSFLAPSTHDSALLTWLTTQSTPNQPTNDAPAPRSTHTTNDNVESPEDLDALDTAFATLATSL